MVLGRFAYSHLHDFLHNRTHSLHIMAVHANPSLPCVSISYNRNRFPICVNICEKKIHFEISIPLFLRCNLVHFISSSSSKTLFTVSDIKILQCIHIKGTGAYIDIKLNPTYKTLSTI